MRQNRLRKWLLGLFMITILALVGMSSRGRGAKGAAHDPLLLAKVARGDLELAVLELGKIEPREKVAIKSKVAGQVAKILVEEGAPVKVGQLLLSLDPMEFERNVEQARQEVKKAKAAVQLARVMHARNVRAFEDRAVSRSDVDTAKSDYKTKRIALKQAMEMQRVSEDQLRYSRISSPINGTVIQRNIRAGETVVPGTMATMDDRSLMMVADLSTLVARADLNQIDVAKVQLGQEVALTLDSLPGQSYRAKVTKIAPAAVTPPGKDVEVFPIEATLKGDNLKNIKPGMTADVKIMVDRKKDILKLPIEAVIKDKGRTYVYRVLHGSTDGKRPITKRVDIEVGARNDREQEIVAGLAEGDEVLIRPPTAEANEYK